MPFGKKLLAEVPVILMAYDLLEHEGVDIRQLPMVNAARLLEDIMTRAAHPLGPLAHLVHPVGRNWSRTAKRAPTRWKASCSSAR